MKIPKYQSISDFKYITRLQQKSSVSRKCTKKRNFLPLFGAMVGITVCLSGCVATLPETIDTLIGTKPKVDSKASTPSGSATVLFTEKKPNDSKRTAVPDGIFTEVFENGDDFYENFRFEDYMPEAFSSKILTKLTADRVSNQKHSNEFEKNVAVQKVQNTRRIMKTKNKSLPDYLAFKVAFNISPKNYLFDRGGFYLKPAYSFLPFSGPFKLNHQSIAASNLVQRPPGKDFDIIWGYGQTRDYTGNNLGFDNHRQKSKSYFEDFSTNLMTHIKVGYLNEQTSVGNYSSRKSNEYSRIKVNQNQFSEILKGGFPVGDSVGSVFYMGYVLVKVDKSNFTCLDRSVKQLGIVDCNVRVDPVKYVINNFLGKEKDSINPEVIDLINDKAIFDRL